MYAIRPPFIHRRTVVALTLSLSATCQILRYVIVPLSYTTDSVSVKNNLEFGRECNESSNVNGVPPVGSHLACGRARVGVPFLAGVREEFLRARARRGLPTAVVAGYGGLERRGRPAWHLVLLRAGAEGLGHRRQVQGPLGDSLSPRARKIRYGLLRLKRVLLYQ